MSTAKLKNIILLVLVFLNLFFLTLIAVDAVRETATRRRTIEQLTQIMQNSGVTVDGDIIPKIDAPRAQSTSRDAYAEATLARIALGDCEPVDSGGTSTTYIADNGEGTAIFNIRSEFVIDYTYGLDISGDLVSAVKKQLRRMKIETEEPRVAFAEGDLTIIVAEIRCRDMPTFNCTVSFEFENSLLMRISGRRPSAITEVSGGRERNLPTAMLGFLQYILDGGAEVTEITEITAGYSMNVGVFGAGELAPVWRFTTDDGVFLVNALTGQVEDVF